MGGRFSGEGLGVGVSGFDGFGASRSPATLSDEGLFLHSGGTWRGAVLAEQVGAIGHQALAVQLRVRVEHCRSLLLILHMHAPPLRVSLRPADPKGCGEWAVGRASEAQSSAEACTASRAQRGSARRAVTWNPGAVRASWNSQNLRCGCVGQSV